MEKYLEVLKHCPLFAQMEERDILVMLDCLGAKVQSFDKKDTIFAEGTPATQIGIVLAGSAQIAQVDYWGNRSIFSSVGPCEVFAEAFACAEVGSLPMAVIANEPCVIMLMNRDRILHTCSQCCIHHQQLILNLVQDLATKNLQFHQKLEITSKRSTREKLMAYLMLQSKKEKSNSFDIPFDRQELADYLQVERSGLSAEISKLRNERVIESNRKHFVIL